MKLFRIILGLVLLLTNMLAIWLPATALAQTDTIELTTAHFKLQGTSGASFVFEVRIIYQGEKARVFDLTAKGPKDWTVYVTPTYPADKRIQDIRIEPGLSVGEPLQVHVATPFWLNPEPGSYDITLEVSSGGLTGSITMQAIITARYELTVKPVGELYSTEATAGKENVFSVQVKNTGTAALHNINLSSDKPEKWNIEFSPEKIDALEVDRDQTVDVKIKPVEKAIAGDYQISLRCSAKETSADALKLRITVVTPSLWGWVGVAIIVIVVVGLGFIMMRFSRR